MQVLLFIFFSVLCIQPSQSQDNVAAFKKQIKTFTKAAQGLYEVRNTDERLSESQKQPQDLLFFPITHWNTDQEAWFCFVWLIPKFKNKPLELVLCQVTYKNADTLSTNFYAMPKNAPENLTFEWKKTNPFSPMTADFIKTEELPCAGYISIEKNSVYNMLSYSPCPRETKTAGYTAILVNSRFKGKSYSSGVKFYAPDGRVIIEHSHEFESKKTSSSLKKY
jgi:hypothetical protein